MSIAGYYYLHTNGELIYKRGEGQDQDIRESDFAIMLWPCDFQKREYAWRILIEALCCGARPDVITALAEKWKCDDLDAMNYAVAVNAKAYFTDHVWTITRHDFVNLNESPAGVGASALTAFASLCSTLGYHAFKDGNGRTFAQLLE